MFFTRLISLWILVFAYAQLGNLAAQCGFNGLGPNYCPYSPTVQLTPLTAGGSFSGPGVSGSVFDPALAGPGTHTITYGFCAGTYSVSSGTYSPYVGPFQGGPGAGVGGGEGGSIPMQDDQNPVNAALIGFPFQFFCNTYTSFYISPNGFISFSPSQSSGCCSGGFLPGTSLPLNIITLTWTDWNPGVGGAINYTTVGTAPNRKTIVAFTNVPQFGFAGGSMTAQIHLYETTNIIEVHTGSMVTNTTPHTMGIQNSNGTVGYAVAGRNSTPSWSATNEMYRYTPTLGCASTQTTYVSPASVSIAGDNYVCLGSPASFTASSNTTYTWSTGSNQAAVTVTPSSTTTYSVSGTNNFGCVANSIITVTVNSSTPTVTAIASNTSNGVCPGNTLALTASGALTYTWTGGISNGAAFSPTSSASYTVTGQNGCGTSTAALSVSIHPLPTITASANTPTLCEGSMVILTGGGGAGTYIWSDNVINGSAFSPTVTKTYTVIGNSALGCTASAVTEVTVFPSPTGVPVAAPSLVCIGGSSTLSASGVTSFTWMPGNSTSSVVVVSPNSSVIYTLTQSNSNCVVSKTIEITVNALPTTLAFATPSLLCASQTAVLAGAGGNTFTWTAPGYTANGSSPVVSPTVNTTYTMATSDGTCVNTTTVSLSVNPQPTLNLSVSPASICIGDAATLTANGASNYTWTPALGNGVTVVVTPTTASSYIVSGINSFGCIGSTSQVVLVSPLPLVNAFSNKSLVCPGGSATLSAGGTASSYSWSTGVLTSTTLVNPFATTVYTVTGFSSLCHNSAQIAVGVYNPTFAVSGNTAVCHGGAVTISASGASSYTWSTGSPFAGISVSPTIATIYTVSATSNSNNINCISSNTLMVGISPDPTVTATSNKLVACKGDKIILTASGAVTYTWSTLATSSITQVSLNALTIYTVQGTDANGCSGSGTVLVKYSSCTGIEEFSDPQYVSMRIYPNPNNGEFIIQSAGDLELSLLNALGQNIRTIHLSILNNYTVRIEGIANGIYFINSSTGNQVLSRKIIVDK